MIYRQGPELRHVRMNEAHPAQVTPSWYGDSVGHYEGDTLVIDTVGVKADRPLAMVDMYGTPFTDALHVVERYRLLDYEATIESEQRGQRNLRRLQGSDPGFTRNPNDRGKGLLLQFTVEDPGVVFDGRATTQGILERMHWLLDGTRDGDERVLFYSGHGAQIPGYGSSQEVDHLKECLVPHDFDWTEEHAITDAQLAELYSQLPYESRFVAIFDCCHSGGLSRDGGAKVRGITPPDDVRHRALRWDAGDGMWIARDFKPITSDRDVLGDAVRRRAWIGASGASYRLGRGMGVRSLDRADKKVQRDAVGSKGPYLPMILEACAEQELAYEYRHGVTSYGAFTFSLTKELRDARHAPGRKGIDFVGLMKKTTARLHRLDYDQTPALVGPTALTRVAIPWTKRSAS
jgi:hypothetical protein